MSKHLLSVTYSVRIPQGTKEVNGKSSSFYNIATKEARLLEVLPGVI